MWGEVLAVLVDNHWGKLTGTLAGLLFGILTVTFGFFKALFVIACLVVGYIIGKRVDELGSWRELVYRLWGDDR
ncbi:MAG: DUF2273 domain-containing protein [Clostridia bacterium]|nr:DUF2273 domain-containing protein [Clostridia bacterium]